MAQDTVTPIKPSDLMEYTAAMEKQLELDLVFTWVLRSKKNGQKYWVIRLSAFEAGDELTYKPKHLVVREWPTSTHKTLLGLMYNMLFEVDEQERAGQTLAALGA